MALATDNRTYGPEEFFSDVKELIRDELALVSFKRKLRELLVRLCDNALLDNKENYGSLFFQINYLAKKYSLTGRERFLLQRVRRHTGRRNTCTADELKCDLRVILQCISIIYDVQIPHEFDVLPHYEEVNNNKNKYSKKLPSQLRAIVVGKDCGFFLLELDLENDNNEPYFLDLSDSSFRYLDKILHEGVQLNLLESVLDGRNVSPMYVVVEPDFLLDISSVASCFADYGHHPLSFLVNKMRRKPLSQPILLGNFAGSTLDDIIHAETSSYAVNDSIRSNFKEKAIDFCTCPGFNADTFVKNAKDQASNLQQAVDVLFSQYNKDLAVLEPTFICEALGVQGRVDLMTIDFNLLVEQKSGKNNFIEWKKSEHGSKMMPDTHFVQLLLYLGVMMFNFKRNPNDIDVKLLYSRYVPNLGLVNAGFEHKTFAEALKLRNQIVATEYTIANSGFDKILPYLTPNVLNERKIESNYYYRYLLPSIIEVTSPLQSLSSLERAYFCRMATFSYLELMMSKVGKKEGVHNCMADLWNLPLEKKIESGNIFLGLRIVEKKSSSSFNGFDIITLKISNQGTDFLPNFRAGDMVYLYSYPENEEPDARKSLLYSGYLTKISSDLLEVRLGDGQKNPDLIDYYSSCFALEHADSDASSNAEMRGLLEFVTAPVERKKLLLNQRDPVANKSLTLSRSFDDQLDDLLLRIKQATDYFLLVGPPGTGKTHRAIRFIVQEELSNPDSNILLLSYTNRAVDELCSMLVDDLGVEFIRLGRSYGCDRKYRNYLLNAALDVENPKLEILKHKISKSRIVVSTVSYLMSRPNIFLLKHFSLAVIDEASQILEPDLIGILGSHFMDKEKCDVDKFVMVGDYKQLPAVVLQSAEESKINDSLLNDIGFTNCRMSLFQRLIYREKNAGRVDFIGVLNKQGRMHPVIAGFPNSMFYASEKLELVPCSHQLETSLQYAPVSETNSMIESLSTERLLFFASSYCKNPSLSDKVNTYEAQLVAELLVQISLLYGPDFSPHKSVGIIVPYRNQIAMIKREIEKRKKYFPDDIRLDDITIDTVERYQGSQRDVIIFSFTVQYLYQLEFLTSNNFVENYDDGGRIIDPKLNVVMTRARKQLIMVGNAEVLRNNSIYSSMLDYVKEHGKFVDDSYSFDC